MPKKKASLRSNCTILIPTYNRPSCLKRLLSYYDKYGRHFPIIVGDSSPDGVKAENKKIVSSFPNMDIKLLCYDAGMHFQVKLNDMMKHSNEKYSVFCADDDFITPEGIKQCTLFLDKNPDFTVANGHYISFYFKRKKGIPEFFWAPRYDYNSVTFSDPRERLDYIFSNYHQNMYAVHRTGFWKMILRDTVKFTDDVRFGEYLPVMIAMVYGKMKRLDVLYCARQNQEGSEGAINRGLPGFIKDGTYNEKYSRFRQCLALHLVKETGMDVSESEKLIDSYMKAFLRRYSPVSSVSMTDSLRAFANYINLPAWLDNNIRALGRKVFYSKKRRMDYLRKNISDKSSKYYKNFSRIKNHALLYYRE